MIKSFVGVVCQGNMGRNLAKHIEQRGYKVTLHGILPGSTAKFANDYKGEMTEFADNFEILVTSIMKPRIVFVLLENATLVEKVIIDLVKYLESGDTIIDGSDTYFLDTAKRVKELEKSNIFYLGVGVSASESSILDGPALMPGGSYIVYDRVKAFLNDIAAQDNGYSCSAYIGPDGSGHFVKMVHNGIEYGVLQLFSEAVGIFKRLTDVSNDEIHEILSEWNTSELDSYLLEVICDIVSRTDADSGKSIIDVALDRVAYRGTGVWACKSSLDLSVPAPILVESIILRHMSNMKNERVQASKLFPDPEIKKVSSIELKSFVEQVRRAVCVGIICTYAQGFAIIKRASSYYKWNLDFEGIANNFQSNCIIRARYLHMVAQAFNKSPDLENIIFDPYFKGILESYLLDLRNVVSFSVLNGIPIAALTSTISYIDNYRCDSLPTGLIQLVRDYMGINGYERNDKPGEFKTNWNEPGMEITSVKI